MNAYTTNIVLLLSIAIPLAFIACAEKHESTIAPATKPAASSPSRDLLPLPPMADRKRFTPKRSGSTLFDTEIDIFGLSIEEIAEKFGPPVASFEGDKMPGWLPLSRSLYTRYKDTPEVLNGLGGLPTGAVLQCVYKDKTSDSPDETSRTARIRLHVFFDENNNAVFGSYLIPHW